MLTLLAGLAIAYGVSVALLYVAQRNFLYYPDRTRPLPETAGVAEMTEVTLRTGDGVKILAWWRPPTSEQAPVMLYLHGNGGNIGHRAAKVRPYLDRGWGVLLLSWRGYGFSAGHPSEAGLYADAEAAMDYLAVAGIGRERTVVYGESLGSGPAVKLAADGTFSALVLEAPFTSIPDLAAPMFPYVPARWLVRDRFASIDRIPRVSSPLLIVHGERDRTVPVSHGQRLLAAHRGVKEGHFVAGAGHNDLSEFGIDAIVASFVLAQIDVKTDDNF